MIRRVEVRRRNEPVAPYGVPYWAESSPEDLDEEAARARARAKLGFYAHAASYAFVMVLLVVLNLVRSPDRLWFIWPLVGWGIGVIAHAVGVFALARGGSAERYLIDRELRRTS
jgi:hypothetical protein